MIKKISAYFFSFFILLGVAFALHSRTLEGLKIELRFPLLNIYIFHCIISFVICLSVFLLSKSLKWSAQLGFIYIFTFISKFMLFVLVFKNNVFSIEKLSRVESLNLLIPLFLFLFLEVFFIANILNKK